MVIVGRLWVAFIVILYVGDMIAAFLAMCRLWQLNENGHKIRLIRYLGFLMLGILVDGICELIASTDRPSGVQVSNFYTIWFWTGRVWRSATLWTITAFLFNLLPDRFQVDRSVKGSAPQE